MSEHRAAWLSAMRSMTATSEAAALYLDRRLQFTTAVAKELCHSLTQDQHRLVYGISLHGHAKPIYIGQTSNGRRRLWDLPIGESHHVSNSFPPEVWGRVVVVCWQHLLARDETLLREIGTSLVPLGISEEDSQLQAIGLGLEYLLQGQYKPLFNGRKKRRDGTWREVELQGSKSIAARVAPFLPSLYSRVAGVWHSLSVLPAPAEATRVSVEAGFVVFPGTVRDRLSPNPSIERTA